MSQLLKETLGNIQWLSANEERIKDLLPETWTHVANINGLQIGFRLKLLGVDWRSEAEFGKVMAFLEKAGFMLRDGLKFRRNPKTLFPKQVSSPPDIAKVVAANAWDLYAREKD